MAQDSISSTTQEVGNAGMLRLAFYDSTGTRSTISVSFHPGLALFTQPRYQPHQKVNVAVNGSIHVFQLANTEAFELPITFRDLPFFDTPADPREQTDGLQSLFSFVRYTLNYHANICELTTPDGQIETVRYMGGLDSFEEASQNNRSQRAQRYFGTMTFWRVIIVPPGIPTP